MAVFEPLPDAVVQLAACRGAPPEWWFPESTRAETRHALEICSSCAVRDDCRAWAARQPRSLLHGIWGGAVHGRTPDPDPNPEHCRNCRARIDDRVPQARYCSSCLPEHRRARMRSSDRRRRGRPQQRCCVDCARSIEHRDPRALRCESCARDNRRMKNRLYMRRKSREQH
ncbi:WhiB family transcriptional regulator [Candidatus Poriferisodalis sp.]